jgi:hypothetical protein
LFIYVKKNLLKKKGSDEKMVKSLLKKTIPLTFDAITGELEVSEIE